VRVFDTASGQPFAGPGGSFYAYSPQFGGGVFVAAGDVDGDGRAEIITGAGAGGGPHVRVIRASNGQELAGFMAFANFGGGVRVSTTDFNGDLRAELVLTGGAGNAQRVRVTDFHGQTELAGYLGFGAAARNGAFVSAPRGQMAQAILAAPTLPPPPVNNAATSATDQVLSSWNDPADATADALLGATVYPSASAARQARLRASLFALL
jgi:hypothetical protein